MKSLLLLFSFCLLAEFGYAQTAIKAGTIQVGGSVNYYQTSSEITNSASQKIKNRSFNISPTGGYFIADNLAAGINFGYTSTKLSNSIPGNPNFYEQQGRSFGIGPFVKYYQMLTEKFGLTGTLNAGYSHFTTSDANASVSVSTKGDGFYSGLTPGFIFFPTPRLGLGTSCGGLNYYYSTSKADADNSEVTSSSFEAYFNLSQLTFSSTYYFGR